ncbi:MAG: hypothetical protein U0835_13840 [Isosphaeraceae bacterium]
MRRSLVILSIGAALALGLALGLSPAPRTYAQPPPGKLSGFMRPKLEHSKAVLEGLSLENFDLITKNARALKELSEAAEWKVSPNVTYLRYSGEFQRLADELIQQAKERDVDGATLAYVQLTINCVSCHKFVRENRIISALPARTGPGSETRRR